MKKIKQLLPILLSLVILFAAAPAGFAAMSDTSFSDVKDNAWYADAITYVCDNGLMNGTSPATFGPDETMTRGMLATVLYRATGSPAVTASDSFSDTSAGSYYANAVVWASETGVISGYGNGLFGTDDPVSREQLAAILWRYAGSPDAEPGNGFADNSSIASYAAGAVNWARATGIISGTTGNLFAPKENATRAQVAAILQNYMTQNNTDTPETPAPEGKTLVVYFSATGSTETVAGYIAETLDADLFELVPTKPYTSDDLDWTVDGSRVNREHDNPSQRTVELTASAVDNWDSYDTVFIGYPVWWGIAAWPVDGFIAANDFSGKTVIPFCTSTSSGLGQSGELLSQAAGTGNWLEGQRFSSNASKSSVAEWIAELKL